MRAAQQADHHDHDTTNDPIAHSDFGRAVMSSAPGQEVAGARLGLRLGWMGVRPQTLSLALAPVIVGSALAWSEGVMPDWLILATTLLAAALIQAGTNLFNDAADAERGNDGPGRAGPTRLTGSGLADAGAVKRAAWLTFLAALVLGLLLVWKGGWPIMIIGLTGLLTGWAYSRGPLPLSYTPCGEVFVLVFFGIAAVLGSYLLQGGSLPLVTVVPGLALGLPAAAVLLINNYRDARADREAGRRTLALLLGKPASRWLNAALLLAPFPMLVLEPGGALMAPCWLSLPLAGWLSVRLFSSLDAAELNRQMRWTVLFHALLGVLLAAGLFAGDLVHFLTP